MHIGAEATAVDLTGPKIDQSLRRGGAESSTTRPAELMYFAIFVASVFWNRSSRAAMDRLLSWIGNAEFGSSDRVDSLGNGRGGPLE
jgi:hypothetical protein